MEIEYTDALIVVGMQNDYFHGGAVPVEGADRILSATNMLIHAFDHILFARDWHPQDYEEFSEAPTYSAGSWPEHCVQHSPGAEFHGSLHVPLDAFVLGPSDAFDFDAPEPTMDAVTTELQRRNIRRVVVCGVPTEYGVERVVSESLAAGFETWLVTDACRGFSEELAKATLARLEAAGAELQLLDEVL